MMKMRWQPSWHKGTISRLAPLGAMAFAVLMALLLALKVGPMIFAQFAGNQSTAASAGLLFVVGALRLRQSTANNPQASGSE